MCQKYGKTKSLNQNNILLNILNWKWFLDKKFPMLEHLNPMVLPVGHQDVALRVDRDPFQALKLTLALTPSAETSEEGSVRIEDLNSIVSGIRDENVTLFIHGNSSVKKMGTNLS